MITMSEFSPNNPPRCKRPDESTEDYRLAMGWDEPQPDGCSERVKFERWASSKGFCIHRDSTDKYRSYHRATTRWAWEAWTQRASLDARLPEPRELPQVDASYRSNSTYLRALGWNECLAEIAGQHRNAEAE